MTGPICFFLVSVALVIASAHLLKRALSRNSDDGTSWASARPSREQDFLALEIGERIFDAKDWELVRRETPRRFARKFRDERAALALDWLSRIEDEVARLVHEHRRAARTSKNASTIEELGLAFEFFVFQLTTGILRCLILMRGPVNTGKLLGCCLDSAREVRRIAKGAGPHASSAPTRQEL